jgi:SAM-dependent methyltransferase
MTVCAACGAWFTWPQPTPEMLVAHYAQHTAGMPDDLRQYRVNTRQTEWYELLARKLAKAARVSGRTVSTVADIGAGGLELTTSLAREFPAARVDAWDLFADGFNPALPPEIADRISLHKLDLNRASEADIPPHSYDLVACVAVIEHVIEPIALLRLLARITAPGGFAYVVGPRVDSWFRRLMRTSWPYYCPDEHLTLPTITSVRRAVTIAGGGAFEVHRTNVHYSSRYLLRFLHFPKALAAAFDVLVPVPAGAFDLRWWPGDEASSE